MTTHAEQVEDALNLKRQLTQLDDPGDQDFVFQDTSPPTRWDTIYSTQTGEAIRVKRFRLISTLQKTLANGLAAFTAKKENAPTYVLGTVKCFLAKDSPERVVIDDLNISPGYYCIAEHLANAGAAEIHAEHKHPTRWKQYQRYLESQERQLDRERQDAQIQAIMHLATGKTQERVVVAKGEVSKVPCEICSKPITPGIGMRSHMRSHSEVTA